MGKKRKHRKHKGVGKRERVTAPVNFLFYSCNYLTLPFFFFFFPFIGILEIEADLSWMSQPYSLIGEEMPCTVRAGQGKQWTFLVPMAKRNEQLL